VVRRYAVQPNQKLRPKNMESGNVPLPYQPTSGKLVNSSVILGIAVAMIELSKRMLVRLWPVTTRQPTERHQEDT